jgi:hypothetical protein
MARAKDEPPTELLGTQYVAVHPFSDDTETLSRISWESSQCKSVDAYWLVGADVLFVQVESAALSRRAVGQYIRRNATSGYVNCVAVVSAGLVTRAIFEEQLTWLLNAGVVARVLQRQEKLRSVLVDVNEL